MLRIQNSTPSDPHTSSYPKGPVVLCSGHAPSLFSPRQMHSMPSYSKVPANSRPSEVTDDSRCIV